MKLRRNTKQMNLTGMMSRGPVLLIAVLLSALLALSSCGGGGGNTVKNEKDTVLIMPSSAGSSGNQRSKLPPGARALADNEQVTGYLDGSDDVDYFYFPAADGFQEYTLQLDAPTGVEITVMDENGNVIDTAITASTATIQGYYFSGAGALIVRIATASAAVTAGPFVLTVVRALVPAAIAATIVYVGLKIKGYRPMVGGEVKLNLLDFFECKIDDKLVKGCELDFKIAGNVSILDPATNTRLGFEIRKETLYIANLPCEVAGDTLSLTLSYAPLFNGTPGPRKESEFSITPRDSAQCPEKDEPYFVTVTIPHALHKYRGDDGFNIYYRTFENEKKATDFCKSQGAKGLECSKERLYEGDCRASYVFDDGQIRIYFLGQASTAAGAEEAAAYGSYGCPSAVGCTALFTPGETCGSGSP